MDHGEEIVKRPNHTDEATPDMEIPSKGNGTELKPKEWMIVLTNMDARLDLGYNYETLGFP
jgi:hypothetical protein